MSEFSDLESLKKRLREPYHADSTVFHELCSYYLKANAEQQAAIRLAFKEGRGAYYSNYMSMTIDALRASKDVDKLRLALAAVCIENCSTDYRDTLTMLASLYVASEQAGIDPRPYFKEIAKLASENPAPGLGKSLKTTLANFENQPVIGEERNATNPIFSDAGILKLNTLQTRLQERILAGDPLYDQLCAYYLSATAEQQAKIRAIFRKAKFDAVVAILAFMRRMIRQLRESKDVRPLRLALAAACIEDARLDYRDILKILAELYITAEQLGIEPQQHFLETAQFASDKSSKTSAAEEFLSKFRFSLDRPIHYESSPIAMKEILSRFHTNSVLEEMRKSKRPKN